MQETGTDTEVMIEIGTLGIVGKEGMTAGVIAGRDPAVAESRCSTVLLLSALAIEVSRNHKYKVFSLVIYRGKDALYLLLRMPCLCAVLFVSHRRAVVKKEVQPRLQADMSSGVEKNEE